MTISYINFSAMSGHSSMIHMLNSVRSTNKDRQARKDHESNRLDRAMQCRKRKTILKNTNPMTMSAKCRALLLPSLQTF